eukprot:NODE_555_length_6746_cov_0.227170.p3 type:complete len:100 gc:universal NODE_555_length_6746_cov_0.227170:6045-5746(-)
MFIINTPCNTLPSIASTSPTMNLSNRSFASLTTAASPASPAILIASCLFSGSSFPSNVSSWATGPYMDEMSLSIRDSTTLLLNMLLTFFIFLDISSNTW